MFVCGIIISSHIYSSIFLLHWCHHQSWFYLPRALLCIILPTQPASVLSVKVKVVRAPHYANIDGVASMVSYLLSWAI